MGDPAAPQPRTAARATVRRLIGGLGCTGAELVALGVLATGALAALGLLWLVARPAVPPADVAADDVRFTVGADEIVVHVAGAVAAPGLYELPADARLADALAAAGGPEAGAVLDHLNLARPLSDGEQLFVPVPGAATPAPGAAGSSGPRGPRDSPAPSATRPDGTLDLNLATAEELESLPGIGPVLAQRIVDHREAAGGFRSVGELRDVTGIGDRKFADLEARVSV